MPDPATDNWMTSLAIVCASLGLVFAGVAGFQAVAGIHMIGRPWPFALGLWGVGLVLYVLGRRAGPSAPE